MIGCAATGPPETPPHARCPVTRPWSGALRNASPSTPRRIEFGPGDRSTAHLALILLERLLDVHADRVRLSSGNLDRLASLRTTLATGLDLNNDQGR